VCYHQGIVCGFGSNGFHILVFFLLVVTVAALVAAAGVRKGFLGLAVFVMSWSVSWKIGVTDFSPPRST
jgi:hypothetical protein